MLALLFPLLLALPFPAGFDLIRDFEAGYIVNAAGDGVTVSLSWALTSPADAIVVYRGNQKLETLPGDVTSWATTESVFGEYQYSIGYQRDFPNRPPMFFQWETVVLKFGRLKWDKPANHGDGYVVFISTEEAWTWTEPPYFVEGADTLELSLGDLMDAGLIEPGVPVWIRMASYRDVSGGERLLSDTSDPVPLEFGYIVEVLPWAPPQAPTGAGVNW